jgi:hypothetical protein
MGMLVAEQQFSAASLMGHSEACMIGDDIGRILAAAMNSTPSVNVQISEWPRSCRMFSALGCIFCLWAIVCREVFSIYGAWRSLRCDDENFDW